MTFRVLAEVIVVGWEGAVLRSMSFCAEGIIAFDVEERAAMAAESGTKNFFFICGPQPSYEFLQ